MLVFVVFIDLLKELVPFITVIVGRYNSSLTLVRCRELHLHSFTIIIDLGVSTKEFVD